jgi:hypothetical protein
MKSLNKLRDQKFNLTYLLLPYLGHGYTKCIREEILSRTFYFRFNFNSIFLNNCNNNLFIF